MNRDGVEIVNESLVEIEKTYSILLPGAYKEFILSGRVNSFEDIVFSPMEPSPWTNKEGRQLLDGFFALEDRSLSNHIKQYDNRMPGSLIPIGECPGGNLICLGIKGSAKNKVYFWDHENELEAKKMIEIETAHTIDSYWDNLYLVSQSFADFLSKLELGHSCSNADLDGVELWLDDDLIE